MQLMESHSRHRHLRRLSCGIEGRKDQSQAPGVLRLHLSSVPGLEERREPLVPKRLDHDAKCNRTSYMLQPIWLHRIQFDSEKAADVSAKANVPSTANGVPAAAIGGRATDR